MLKFSEETLFSLLKKISKYTEEIADILNKDGKLEENDIDILSGIFDERRLLFDVLDEWNKARVLGKFVKENFDLWSERIGPIIVRDKNNLIKLQSKLKETGDKLKLLTKQKSLLIYTKEKKL